MGVRREGREGGRSWEKGEGGGWRVRGGFKLQSLQSGMHSVGISTPSN